MGLTSTHHIQYFVFPVTDIIAFVWQFSGFSKHFYFLHDWLIVKKPVELKHEKINFADWKNLQERKKGRKWWW
jgi:hypothetical protein